MILQFLYSVSECCPDRLIARWECPAGNAFGPGDAPRSSAWSQNLASASAAWHRDSQILEAAFRRGQAKAAPRASQVKRLLVPLSDNHDKLAGDRKARP